MESSGGGETTAGERRQCLRMYYLAGLMDIGLAAVIGFLGVRCVEGETTLLLTHMLGGGILASAGLVTIWYGRRRYGAGRSKTSQRLVVRLRD